MADKPATDDDAPEQRPDQIVTFWTDQLAAYDDEFKDWKSRCKKIIRRYRDEREEKQDGGVVGGCRFNSLWSNTQTLFPAIYIKPPDPVVERRYLDKDPIARTASMTLERACEVQIEVGKLHPSMRKAVLDYLLCGRATVWERYEPTYGEPTDLGQTDKPEEETPGEKTKEAAEAPRPVTYEKVCTDYVAWDKFRHSPSNIWDDVWWVSKDEMLTRKELRARFKGKAPGSDKLLADVIPMRPASTDKTDDRERKRKNPRALVVEIWNKRDREVIFIAPDYKNAPLEVTDDPLSLAGFYPCPEPLYATTTNDTLVPVPDYAEYQDQADQLDNLAARIKALTDAVRVNGVYDSSIPELKRILSEGVDNRMIAVKNWAELTTKGGLTKSMDFVPLKDVVAALVTLHEAFDSTQQKMDQINGLSDIVRGQSSGSAKTATEQRIKGQFASLRLDDRKKEVARFARDTIAIKGEIIAEQFSPEILSEMTGMLAFLTDEIKAEMPPQTPQPSPMIGHNGGPPLDSPPGVPAPGPGAPGPANAPPPAGLLPPQNGAPIMLPPPLDPAQMAQERFAKAVELLKNDKMRTFRIDIETDSTVEPDKQAAKEAVTEMTTAVGGLLEKSLPIGQMMPQLAAPLGQTLLFVLRTFGAGRDVEGIWEDAIEKMAQAAKNPGPKPPSPEEIKAQAEKQKMEMEAQQQQQQAALDQQRGEQEMAMKERESQMKLREREMELQLKEREFALREREIEMESAAKLRDTQINAAATEHAAQIDGAARDRQAQIAEEQDNRQAEQGERGHELAIETMEAKAKMAKQPRATA